MDTIIVKDAVVFDILGKFVILNYSLSKSEKLYFLELHFVEVFRESFIHIFLFQSFITVTM